MKRKTAKEIFAESLRELAETRNIDKITISDLAGNCGYSPATFYRNFRDKYDLIAWDHAQSTSRIMSRIGEDGYGWKQALLNAAHHYYSQREYLANLFRHTSGQDSFIQYMTEINYDALRKFILKVSGRTELSMQDNMYIRIYCLGTVCLTCEWILGRYEATPEQIADVYEQALPAPLNRLII